MGFDCCAILIISKLDGANDKMSNTRAFNVVPWTGKNATNLIVNGKSLTLEMVGGLLCWITDCTFRWCVASIILFKLSPLLWLFFRWVLSLLWFTQKRLKQEAVFITNFIFQWKPKPKASGNSLLEKLINRIWSIFVDSFYNFTPTWWTAVTWEFVSSS